MRLAILGASGHGKVVADAAECSGWNAIEFFDDAWPEISLNGAWPIVGDSTTLIDRVGEFDGVSVAIGNNQIRHKKLLELKCVNARLATIIHPAAIVSRYASIGEGSVVFASAVVNSDALVGFGAIINTGCSIDHDCVLGDAVHISPGARLAGGVQLGKLSWIGIGANVRQQISIGSGVTVGAGSTVICDIPDNLIVAGVPAKMMRQS